MLEALCARLRRSDRRCRPSMARAWSICSRRCCRYHRARGRATTPRKRTTTSPTRPLKLAIVGRPNAGKSTLINRMLGEDRLITGPEAGHHARFDRDRLGVARPDGEARAVRLIDTAGMRKRAKVQDKLEKLSVADALHAVDFAEVVVLLLDATRGLEAQDLRIADRCCRKAARWSSRSTNGTSPKTPSALFNGVKRGARGRAGQVKGVPLLTVSGATGKGHRPAAQGRVRDARGLVAARRHRRAQPLVRDARSRPIRRPRRAASGSSCATSPRSRRARRASSCSARASISCRRAIERYLVNGMRRDLGFGAVPVRLTLRAPKNPFDHGKRRDAGDASDRRARHALSLAGDAAGARVARRCGRVEIIADDPTRRASWRRSRRRMDVRSFPTNRATFVVTCGRSQHCVYLIG